MKKKTRRRKYYINKPGRIAIAVIIIFLLFIIYVLITYEQQQENISIINALIEKRPINATEKEGLIETAKIFLTVGISIIISSIISTFLVGKNDKNDVYSEAVEDFITDSNLKFKIEEDNDIYKTTTVKKLQEEGYPKDMIRAMLQGLFSTKRPFYFDTCEMDVKCSLSEDGKYMVKQIKKEIILYSLKDKYVYDENNEFILTSMTSKKDINNPLKIIKLEIEQNNHNIKDNKHRIDKEKTSDNLSRKQGYENVTIAYLDQRLELSSKEPVKMKIIYETKVPISDKNYVFRLPCACRKLKFSFRIEGMKNYKLNGYAFGFIDDASSTLNYDNSDDIFFSFKDWAYPYDGICISMEKNNDFY